MNKKTIDMFTMGERAGHWINTSTKKGQALQQMAFTGKACPIMVSKTVFRLPEDNLGPFQQEHVPYPQQVVNWQCISIQGEEPLAAVHGW